MSFEQRTRVPRLLSTLLIGLALVVLSGMAWFYVHARNRAAAIRYAYSTDGYVEFGKRPEWLPESVDVPDWLYSIEGVTLGQNAHSDLRRVLALREIRQLRCGGEFEDRGFEPIDRFPQLIELDVCWDVDEDALRHIQNCHRLESLSLAVSDITDDQLHYLTNLPLRKLDLAMTKISDKGLEKLAALPLQELDLAATPITDDGLKQLAGMPLTSLTLSATEITDAGLEHLLALPLQQLNLDDTKITDAGIAKLSALPLRQLRLDQTDVTEEGLRVLTGKGIHITR